MDDAGLAERRHGAAQPIGFGGSEAGGNDRDPHRLLLEERHAQGLLKDLAQLLRGIIKPLLPITPTQIRMHHVALDRPRANDRDLDDEIVEIPRLQARQHGHLGAALDLEDADRVGAAQHVVDRRLLGRDGGEGQVPAVMLADEVEGLTDAGQHAESEDVDLEDVQRVDVVLVPFDEGTIGHRCVLDRHQLGERAAGDDEAADMLREMSREPDERTRQLERQAQGRIGGIEPSLAHTVVLDAIIAPAPDAPGERGRHVARQAHDLANLADGAARAVADHRGGDAGAVARVFLVDVLNHLLAPLMLEIDIDIGRLVALGRDEALEEEVDASRIDLGDAEGSSTPPNSPPSRAPGRGCPFRARNERCRGR